MITELKLQIPSLSVSLLSANIFDLYSACFLLELAPRSQSIAFGALPLSALSVRYPDFVRTQVRFLFSIFSFFYVAIKRKKMLKYIINLFVLGCTQPTATAELNQVQNDIVLVILSKAKDLFKRFFGLCPQNDKKITFNFPFSTFNFPFFKHSRRVDFWKKLVGTFHFAHPTTEFISGSVFKSTFKSFVTICKQNIWHWNQGITNKLYIEKDRRWRASNDRYNNYYSSCRWRCYASN